MKLSGSDIIIRLRQNLQVNVGRHLYAVLGDYQALSTFEKNDLVPARRADGTNLPQPTNLNRTLLDCIGDDELRTMVSEEGKYPISVKRKLGIEFDNLLAHILGQEHFVILRNLELLFAFELEMEIVRARATNENHILLLLPGEVRGDHVVLFTEADQRFQRQLPFQLIAENHLWELDNA